MRCSVSGTRTRTLEAQKRTLVHRQDRRFGDAEVDKLARFVRKPGFDTVCRSGRDDAIDTAGHIRRDVARAVAERDILPIQRYRLNVGQVEWCSVRVPRRPRPRERKRVIGTLLRKESDCDQYRMAITPIVTEADYDRSLQRIERFMESELDAKTGAEFDALVTLVHAYEEKHHPIDPPV